MFKLYKLKDYNFRLVLWLISITAMGVLLVGSAMQSLQTRQLYGAILGVIVMVVISLIDFSWVLNFYWIMYGANIVLLIALRFAATGREIGGATRWIEIGGFQFQPTELAKIILILFFAKFLMDHEDDLNTLKTLVQSIVLLAVPLTLIYIQPDMKNTITTVVLFCGLLYVAGLSYKVITGTLLIIVPLVFVFLFLVTQTDLEIIDPYQKTRIMSFIYPEDDAYSDSIIQQENSVIAIGSGQLSGKGYNNNEVASANKGNFVSQIQTDFIFAVAGEELGFLGAMGIIVLLFLICLECVLISRRAKDMSGKLICCGVATIVAFQSFINIGVAIGIIPNTGTPLPFVSYGLTSIVSLYIGMGVVLNVGLQNRNYLVGEPKQI